MFNIKAEVSAEQLTALSNLGIQVIIQPTKAVEQPKINVKPRYCVLKNGKYNFGKVRPGTRPYIARHGNKSFVGTFDVGNEVQYLNVTADDDGVPTGKYGYLFSNKG
jgi:hypothetical protein